VRYDEYVCNLYVELEQFVKAAAKVNELHPDEDPEVLVEEVPRIPANETELGSDESDSSDKQSDQP
jgi:hypothetical protein